jgi:hypothetical protein
MNEIECLKYTVEQALSFTKSQAKIKSYEYNFDETNYISMTVMEFMSKGRYGTLVYNFTDEEVENIEKQIQNNSFVYDIPDPKTNMLRENALEVLHHFTKKDEFGFGIDFDDAFTLQFYLMKLYNQKEIYKAFKLSESFFK